MTNTSKPTAWMTAKRLREVVEMAGRGRWRTHRSVNNGDVYVVDDPYGGSGCVALADTEANARLIVALRNLVPDLTACADALDRTADTRAAALEEAAVIVLRYETYWTHVISMVRNELAAAIRAAKDRPLAHQPQERP